MNELDAIIRLLLSALLSGLIGLERHAAHRPAGIRTNVLVGLGATLTMLLALRLTGDLSGIDPGRFAGQVLTGIGFIGAGVVFHYRGEPHGVTTAATIFVVACIGLALGAGEYLIGTVAGLLALVTLRIVGGLEHKDQYRNKHD